MLGEILALAASLAYGVSDFLGGLPSRSTALLSVLVVSQGVALVLLSVIVILRGEGPPDGVLLLYAAFAGLSEAAGVAALYRSLAVGTMSVVAPVGATVPVVAGIALREVPASTQGAGIVLAVAGMALTSLRRASGGVAACWLRASPMGCSPRSASEASSRSWTRRAKATSLGRCSLPGSRR